MGLGLTGVGLGVGVGTSVASKHSYDNADSIAAQIKKNAAADSNQINPDTSSLCRDPQTWLTQRHYVENMKTPDITTRTGEYNNACSKYPDNVNRGDTLKTIATVGFVVAASRRSAPSCTISSILTRGRAKKTRARVCTHRAAASRSYPPSAPRRAGLTIMGSF